MILQSDWPHLQQYIFTLRVFYAVMTCYSPAGLLCKCLKMNSLCLLLIIVCLVEHMIIKKKRQLRYLDICFWYSRIFFKESFTFHTWQTSSKIWEWMKGTPCSSFQCCEGKLGLEAGNFLRGVKFKHYPVGLEEKGIMLCLIFCVGVSCKTRQDFYSPPPNYSKALLRDPNTCWSKESSGDGPASISHHPTTKGLLLE